MKYYEQGSLYAFLDESPYPPLCWRQIINMLWDISSGVNFIHQLGLVHGNLHGGNVLVVNEADSIEAKVADAGLQGPVNKDSSSNHVYGVIPFVAPEIFKGDEPTKESDIYSFGMIMWMLSSGLRPHYDKPHNILLSKDVCTGLRPSVVVGTPPIFTQLMLQCLDDNPKNRPEASFIFECLENWIEATCDNPNSNHLSEVFDTAEEEKFQALIKLNNFSIPQCHNDSCYYSRRLTILNVRTN